MRDKDTKGLIFDIQGYSVHDGPGCRTLIFLKGCPLECKWCSNPEGISPLPQLMYYQDRCIGNFDCVKACRSQAVCIDQEREVAVIDRTICRGCVDLECMDVCDHNALLVSGYYMTIEELMKTIQRDRQYWGAGGGVTLSGGDPMLQYNFTRSVLQRCHDSYIHTAMETSGHAPWAHFEGILDYLDWIFFDIKHMDPKMHRMATGVLNNTILDNAKKIAQLENIRMMFRMVMVPGFNDSFENVKATAEFIKGVGQGEINILPLHHLGSSKYKLLGLTYNFDLRTTPTRESMEWAREIFAEHSIECYIGNDTPF